METGEQHAEKDKDRAHADRASRRMVEFRCRTRNTDPLPPVFVSGNIEELGQWILSRAVRLEYEGGGNSGHQWSVRVEVPNDRPFEYKYFLLQPQWEGSDNRKLEAGEDDISTQDFFKE